MTLCQHQQCTGVGNQMLRGCFLDHNVMDCLGCWQYYCYLWPPYVIGGPLYFCPVVSLYLLSIYLLFFSSPNLSGRRSDVCHTSTHGVALVRIYNAGPKCAARDSLQIQDAKKSPSRHHRTTLSGHIFTTKACIDNRKKNLLSSNISSLCPHNMVNFDPLTAEIGSGVWGTPTHFNGFCVLAALLHGI